MNELIELSMHSC